MERITTQRHAELISAALDIVPVGIRQRLGPFDFFVGDPLFCGLHDYEDSSEETGGNSYRETMHFCWPAHLYLLPRSKRTPTVVIPPAVFELYKQPLHTLVHEIGHVLHWKINFSWRVEVPVSSYAMSDHYECFADFFGTWCLPNGEFLARGKRKALWWDNMQYDLETI